MDYEHPMTYSQTSSAAMYMFQKSASQPGRLLCKRNIGRHGPPTVKHSPDEDWKAELAEKVAASVH